MRIAVLAVGAVLLLSGCRESAPDSAYPAGALEACADMSVSEWTEGPGYEPVVCNDVRTEQGWEGGA